MMEEVLDKVKTLNASYLDKDYILYKFIEDKWVGKYAVNLKDLSVDWLENITNISLIKNYPCGKDADYSKTFTIPSFGDFINNLEELGFVPNNKRRTWE